MASKNSAALSLPKSRTVRGYEIRKMPIGAFLEACSLLEELPGTALRLLFPEKKEGDILAELAGLDKDKLQELFLRALAVLPGEMVRLFARLSGVEEQALLEDARIGLDGLGEMAEAWLEVNGIENFIKTMGALGKRHRLSWAERALAPGTDRRSAEHRHQQAGAAERLLHG